MIQAGEEFLETVEAETIFSYNHGSASFARSGKLEYSIDGNSFNLSVLKVERYSHSYSNSSHAITIVNFSNSSITVPNGGEFRQSDFELTAASIEGNRYRFGTLTVDATFSGQEGIYWNSRFGWFFEERTSFPGWYINPTYLFLLPSDP
ncbi:MAG: hypothetical protein ACP5I4_04890 [Oceanipulchritudo sp.]